MLPGEHSPSHEHTHTHMRAFAVTKDKKLLQKCFAYFQTFRLSVDSRLFRSSAFYFAIPLLIVQNVSISTHCLNIGKHDFPPFYSFAVSLKRCKIFEQVNKLQALQIAYCLNISYKFLITTLPVAAASFSPPALRAFSSTPSIRILDASSYYIGA